LIQAQLTLQPSAAPPEAPAPPQTPAFAPSRTPSDQDKPTEDD